MADWMDGLEVTETLNSKFKDAQSYRLATAPKILHSQYREVEHKLIHTKSGYLILRELCFTHEFIGKKTSR